MFESTTNLGRFQEERSFAAQSIDFERDDGQRVHRVYALVAAILRTPQNTDCQRAGAKH
jgi:hypothetical protein